MIPVIDWLTLTSEELDQLLNGLNAELHRRHVMSNAEQTIDEIANATLGSEGLTPGDAWRQPVTIGYPKDWLVTHAGTEWVSLVANNVWEPGVSAWREAAGPGGPPEWIQPTGAHDAYQIDDLVTFNALVYRCVIADNVWSPAAYPAGWELED